LLILWKPELATIEVEHLNSTWMQWTSAYERVKRQVLIMILPGIIPLVFVGLLIIPPESGFWFGPLQG